MTTPIRWADRERDLEGDVRWFQARAGLGTWEHTARQGSGVRLTLLGTLVVCGLLMALFLASIAAGHRLMCATHKDTAGHGAISYCPDYQPQEPAR